MRGEEESEEDRRGEGIERRGERGGIREGGRLR